MTRLFRMRIVGALTATFLISVATVPSVAAAGPNFRLPFECGQKYVGSTYAGHGLAVDFNQKRDADAGDPVLASAGGTVTDGWGIAVNGQIAVDHGGGWQTVYAHMSGILVREGQRVVAGQVLGSVDDAGFAAGEHLHYEQKLREAVVRSSFDGVPYEYGKRIRSTNCSVRPSDIATFYEIWERRGPDPRVEERSRRPSRSSPQRIITPV